MFFKKIEVKLSISPRSKKSDLLITKAKNNQGLSWPFHKKTIWRKIKTWLFLQLIEGERLTRKYFEVEIHKRQSEADKIAAQIKNITAQIDVLKQKEVIEFNKIINEIFKDDGLPQAAKYMKLAKVLEMNPHVLDYFKNVKKITEITELDEKQRVKLND